MVEAAASTGDDGNIPPCGTVQSIFSKEYWLILFELNNAKAATKSSAELEREEDAHTLRVVFDLAESKTEAFRLQKGLKKLSQKGSEDIKNLKSLHSVLMRTKERLMEVQYARYIYTRQATSVRDGLMASVRQSLYLEDDEKNSILQRCRDTLTHWILNGERLKYELEFNQLTEENTKVKLAIKAILEPMLALSAADEGEPEVSLWP